MSEPPRALVTAGRVRFGTFSGPVEDVNLVDAAPWRVPIPRRLRALRLKEWQACQFGNGRHFVVVALFNAKVLALAQVKVYDRKQRTSQVFERQLPGWAFDVPRNLLHSALEWSSADAAIRFDNRLREGRVELAVRVEESRDCAGIEGRLVADTKATEAQVVSIPFGPNRGMYSHKACLPVTGELSVGGEPVAFDPENSFLFLDDHKGYYPYVMRWDWVVGAGFDEKGRRIGFNLTRNASVDPERYNENCLWVDGKRHLLPPVHFERQQRPEEWRVRDDAGEVDIVLEVELTGTVRVNAWVIESRYRGPFGRFRGTLRGPGGTTISVDGFTGMGEDFYLRC